MRRHEHCSESLLRKNGPRFAVALLSYHQPVRIRLAISALLAQHHAPSAVRIFDNTEDNSVELAIADILDTEPRLSYVRNRENIGALRNWEQALRWASRQEEYCALASDHDVVSPEWAAELLHELEQDPRTASACTHFQKVSEGDGTTLLIDRSQRSIDADSSWQRGLVAIRRDRLGGIAYGIHRSAVASRIGMKEAPYTDRIFATELAYHGRIRVVPNVRYTFVQQTEKRRSNLAQRQASMLPLPQWMARHTALAHAWGLFVWAWVRRHQRASFSRSAFRRTTWELCLLARDCESNIGDFVGAYLVARSHCCTRLAQRRSNARVTLGWKRARLHR